MWILYEVIDLYLNFFILCFNISCFNIYKVYVFLQMKVQCILEVFYKKNYNDILGWLKFIRRYVYF